MSQWNKKRRVIRHYDQSARVYDAQYRVEQEAKIRVAVGNLAFARTSIILDAGCGTGLLFEHLVGKAGFIVGIDISRGILKEAKKKAKTLENIALILLDADNMPFSDQTFDVVFAITLLQNTPDPLGTLNEIKRVNKSNGTIIATGLRKAFSKEEFIEMLRKANLKVEMLKLDELMKEYVSVCTKMRCKL